MEIICTCKSIILFILSIMSLALLIVGFSTNHWMERPTEEFSFDLWGRCYPSGCDWLQYSWLVVTQVLVSVALATNLLGNLALLIHLLTHANPYKSLLTTIVTHCIGVVTNVVGLAIYGSRTKDPFMLGWSYAACVCGSAASLFTALIGAGFLKKMN